MHAQTETSHRVLLEVDWRLSRQTFNVVSGRGPRRRERERQTQRQRQAAGAEQQATAAFNRRQTQRVGSQQEETRQRQEETAAQRESLTLAAVGELTRGCEAPSVSCVCGSPSAAAAHAGGTRDWAGGPSLLLGFTKEGSSSNTTFLMK